VEGVERQVVRAAEAAAGLGLTTPQVLDEALDLFAEKYGLRVSTGAVSDPRQRMFLKAVSEGATVSLACSRVHISLTTFYNKWLEEEVFSREYEAARVRKRLVRRGRPVASQ
jgi:hypothetical protein